MFFCSRSGRACYEPSSSYLGAYSCTRPQFAFLRLKFGVFHHACRKPWYVRHAYLFKTSAHFLKLSSTHVRTPNLRTYVLVVDGAVALIGCALRLLDQVAVGSYVTASQSKFHESGPASLWVASHPCPRSDAFSFFGLFGGASHSSEGSKKVAPCAFE